MDQRDQDTVHDEAGLSSKSRGFLWLAAWQPQIHECASDEPVFGGYSHPGNGNIFSSEAKSGNMIIYAEEDESSWDAALLLAGYFRIWPTAMNLDSSTMCPLARVTSLVLDFSLSS